MLLPWLGRAGESRTSPGNDSVDQLAAVRLGGVMARCLQLGILCLSRRKLALVQILPPNFLGGGLGNIEG